MTSAGAQRGTTLIECLVATAIGVALAGGFCHALVTYQAGYRAHASRVAQHQQAQFALDLIVEEMRLAVWDSQGTRCPEPGVRLVGSRVSFTANLHDRPTELRQPAETGQVELTVSRALFEPNDLIRLIDVGNPVDPSDDSAECVKLTGAAGARLTADRPLIGRFRIGSAVSAINLVSYSFDARGRLMRFQDGGSQRVAEEVSEFVAQRIDRELLLGMEMRAAGPEQTPVHWERRILFGDAP